MDSITTRLEYGAKIVLYVLVAFLPLGFVPLPVGIDLGREVVIGVLAMLIMILWLLGILASGEIRYRASPFSWGAGVLVLILGASAFFSKAPLFSAVFADPSAEKLVSLIVMVILMASAAGVLRRREEAGTLLTVLILSGAVSALLGIIQILTGFSFLQYAGLGNGIDANVIGTINGVSLFYAVLLAMTAGLVLASPTGEWRGWRRIILLASMVLFFVFMLIVNFRISWMVLLGTSVLLFGLAVIQNRASRDNAASSHSGWRWWMTLAMIAVSAVMIVVQRPVVPGINLPPEVTPSLSATVSVARAVMKEGSIRSLLGSGPGTFGMDWSLYKDPAINQTIFWNARFVQGQSWASTLLATSGIIGLTGFVIFSIGGLVLFLRMLFKSRSGDAEYHMGEPPVTSALMGYTAALISAFLYPANFSLAVLLFLTGGLLMVFFSEPSYAGSDSESEDPISSPEPFASRGLWDVKERTVRFTAPWAVFVSSLAVILFVVLGISGIYFGVGHLRAAIAMGRGVEAVNRGAVDEGVLLLEAASQIEPNNFLGHHLLVGARTQAVRAIIGRASQGENVQQEFQSVVSAAVQNSQRALALHPADAALWRTQGALYELIIPFIQGAEQFAFSSYRKASELDPTNPGIYVDWGRSGLVFTDRIQLAINQATSEKDRTDLSAARTSNLGEIAKVFQRAVELKPDFASAHFLLAQTAIRLGDTASAIRSVENAKRAAPFDIGVAFQLGILYYQRSDLDRAAQEFARAISMNENYSNARYFLGLIHDRRGDRALALAEFSRIQALNPDNQEVKTILENLRAGKPALDRIVPPAAPPEKRTEAPVREEGTRRETR